MVEAFLKSVLNGVNKLGWASAKKIAQHTDWAEEDVLEALKMLEKNGDIRSRAKGRGYQYGPLILPEKDLSIEDSTIQQEPPPPPNTIFSSIDEFLLNGIRALPKNRAFSADEFGEELIRYFPNVSWTKDDVVGGIGKLVRLGRLALRPFLDNASLKYHYIVK